MKIKSSDVAYDVSRLENGRWVWFGFGDSRDEGKVELPKEVHDRIAQGRPGKLEVEGRWYWIKATEKKLNAVFLQKERER
jgi:hypothetical protein